MKLKKSEFYAQSSAHFQVISRPFWLKITNLIQYHVKKCSYAQNMRQFSKPDQSFRSTTNIMQNTF